MPANIPELENGFIKATMHNIPSLSNHTIFKFISKTPSNKELEGPKKSKDVDLRVDYVQVRKVAEIYEIRAVVFPAGGGGKSSANIYLKLDTKKDEILETSCKLCARKVSCTHILTFLFWLYQKSMNTEEPAILGFWGSESLATEERAEASQIRELFAYDECRLENDMHADVSESDSQDFLEAILNGLEEIGQRDSALFRHCRTIVSEFEPLYVHHALLNASNNFVKDMPSFILHMEDQAKEGLFGRLAEVSKHSYKTPLWLEAQYMRLRCSLFHRIVSRKEPLDDQEIINTLFCKGREQNAVERQKLKQHKRFILKQTEKLENKTYSECGLLLTESYPYVCAAPDGITDDHIVEIKVPKTDEEFEKYLEGREIITPKYMAQIQIQMYMAKVRKALYCVLSPTFDTNGALHYVWVKADMEFVASLLRAAEEFWKDVVFPVLNKIYLGEPVN